MAFERAGESELRRVPDPARDGAQRRVGLSQQPSSDDHSPPGQVAQRRLTDESGETPGERRPRQSRLGGQRGDGPAMRRVAVHGLKCGVGRRIIERCRPASGGCRSRAEPGPQDVNQQRVEQRGHDGVRAGTGAFQFGCEQIHGRTPLGLPSEARGEVDEFGQVVQQRVGAGRIELVGPTVPGTPGRVGAPTTSVVRRRRDRGSFGSQAGAADVVVGLSVSVCPRPWGRNSMSPTASGTGLSSGGTSQHGPCRTTWKPADPGTDTNCRAQGACQVTRAERGWPVRMIAITSLSTSITMDGIQWRTIRYEPRIFTHGSSSTPRFRFGV